MPHSVVRESNAEGSWNKNRCLETISHVLPVSDFSEAVVNKNRECIRT